MDPKVFIIVNAIVCSLLTTITHLGFGIANAYVSSKTTDAKKINAETLYGFV